MKIHRRIGGKLYNAAAPQQMVGAPVVVYQTPYRYVDRQITADMLVDSYKMPLIFSSLSFLSRLCFGGLDFKMESIDGPEDDTKELQITQALSQIKEADKTLARIGRNKNCTTLECVRKAALEGWTFNRAFFERAQQMGEGNVYYPRLQHLPSQSFNRTPASVSGNNRYQVDNILKGIIFDTQEAEPHFFQNVDAIREPIEIPADQLMFIEDTGIPDNTSLLHSVASTIELMKQARHDFRLALARVGTPKEVAEVDGAALAAMKNAGIDIAGGYQSLVDYCNNMVQTQSTNQAEVALPGVKFRYPVIPIALNPMDVEKFIEQIILNHFFAKAITEQLAQAISVSSTPGKALLDSVISGHQEVIGKPFEKLWQEFLDINGYDLLVSFDYWSWSPKDQKAEADKATTMFSVGGSLVNDYRAAMGEDPYTPEQIRQLFEEQNALKRGTMPGEPGEATEQEQPEKPKEAALEQIAETI